MRIESIPWSKIQNLSKRICHWLKYITFTQVTFILLAGVTAQCRIGATESLEGRMQKLRITDSVVSVGPNYRPQMKLQEGNVFTRICLSTGDGCLPLEGGLSLEEGVVCF